MPGSGCPAFCSCASASASHSRASLTRAVSGPRSAVAQPVSKARTAIHASRLMPPPAPAAASARGEPHEPIHVGSKRLRDGDGAIGLLVVLDHRHYRPPDGEPGAVQRRAVFRPAATVRAEADLGAPPTERVIVGARRDLTIAGLPGQPRLDVVALRGAESEIADATLDHPIRNLEALQDGLGVRDHRLQLRIGLGRGRELHELDLVELALALDALHVLAVRARLAPVARRERGVPTW